MVIYDPARHKTNVNYGSLKSYKKYSIEMIKLSHSLILNYTLIIRL